MGLEMVELDTSLVLPGGGSAGGGSEMSVITALTTGVVFSLFPFSFFLFLSFSLISSFSLSLCCFLQEVLLFVPAIFFPVALSAAEVSFVSRGER